MKLCEDFHPNYPNFQKAENVSADSLVFCQLVPTTVNNCPEPPLDCPPAFKYLIFSRDSKWVKYLVRGDARGRLCVWKIPDTPECAAMQLSASQPGGKSTVISYPTYNHFILSAF